MLWPFSVKETVKELAYQDLAVTPLQHAAAMAESKSNVSMTRTCMNVHMNE